MKAKTRAKLAARGLGPRARRRCAGQRSRAERRAAARPGPSAAVTEVPSGAPSAVTRSGVELERPAPPVEELPGVGAVLEPPPGSVRVRLRLRPAVARGLDIEAARVGMARDSLCRFVLEEMARKAVEDGPLAGGAAGEECSDPSFIPAGYVGVDDAGDDVAEGGSESASEGDVGVRPAGEARSPAGSAAGPGSDDSARPASLVPLLGFRSGGRAVQLGGGPCAPAAAACRFGWPRWLPSVPRFPWVRSLRRRVTPSRARATMASTWSTAGAVACGAARRDGALPRRRARQRSSGRRRGPTRPGSGSRRLADRALSVPGLLGRLSCSSAVLVLRDFASRGLLPAFLPGARVSSCREQPFGVSSSSASRVGARISNSSIVAGRGPATALKVPSSVAFVSAPRSAKQRPGMRLRRAA